MNRPREGNFNGYCSYGSVRKPLRKRGKRAARSKRRMLDSSWMSSSLLFTPPKRYFDLVVPNAAAENLTPFASIFTNLQRVERFYLSNVITPPRKKHPSLLKTYPRIATRSPPLPRFPRIPSPVPGESDVGSSASRIFPPLLFDRFPNALSLLSHPSRNSPTPSMTFSTIRQLHFLLDTSGVGIRLKDCSRGTRASRASSYNAQGNSFHRSRDPLDIRPSTSRPTGSRSHKEGLGFSTVRAKGG